MLSEVASSPPGKGCSYSVGDVGAPGSLRGLFITSDFEVLSPSLLDPAPLPETQGCEELGEACQQASRPAPAFPTEVEGTELRLEEGALEAKPQVLVLSPGTQASCVWEQGHDQNGPLLSSPPPSTLSAFPFALSKCSIPQMPSAFSAPAV